MPDAARNTERDFAHYVPTPTSLPGATARVFLGALAGSRSPVHTFTPLVGAQIDIDANATLVIDVNPAFEHGVLCDLGSVQVDATTLAVADLGYQSPGNSSLRLCNIKNRPARVLLLGGTPFAEQLVMWWNFVGRSHEDIAHYRRLWENGSERFGAVQGYRGAVPRLPAPPLPITRMRPRPHQVNRE